MVRRLFLSMDGDVAVRYVEDMDKATIAEFDKEEAEWREAAERQVSSLCEIEDPLPTPEELDGLDSGEAIRRIETVVQNNAQLCVAAEGDTRSWGEIAVARVKARTTAKPQKHRLAGHNQKKAALAPKHYLTSHFFPA
jgi:hypothetical protein